MLREFEELPEFGGQVISSVNQRGIWDSRPLHIAICRGFKEEVATLLDAGADPNARGEYGERPLLVAINCDENEMVEMLLRAGARCELKDDKGFDAWDWARMLKCEGKLMETVERVVRPR